MAGNRFGTTRSRRRRRRATPDDYSSVCTCVWCECHMRSFAATRPHDATLSGQWPNNEREANGIVYDEKNNAKNVDGSVSLHSTQFFFMCVCVCNYYCVFDYFLYSIDKTTPCQYVNETPAQHKQKSPFVTPLGAHYSLTTLRAKSVDDSGRAPR